MYNWYIGSRDLVHRDITNIVAVLRGVSKEEQVSAVECGFHRSADKVRRGFAQLSKGVVKRAGTKSVPEDDDDWRFSVCQESETFPDHEARGHDRGKVEYL